MTATTNSAFSPNKWRVLVMSALAFWLSSSILLDFVVMPNMYAAGMMNQPGFASAGYQLFEVFNHLEVVCAALVLTGMLIIRNGVGDRWQVYLAAGLLAITLIYTYGLTPEMGALGLQLDQFQVREAPALMNQMHSGYWFLEILKLAMAGALLKANYRQAQ